MSESEPTLVEQLLDDFVARLQRGETPAIADYETAHPECGPQIRALFPTVLAMEQAARRRQQELGAKAMVPDVPERLGDYRLVREVGRGGMGIVYEAEQESLLRRVAVKVLPRSALLNPRTLQRFQREAQTAARLHHTNIVPVFGVGEDQGFHYIVMQLIQGVGLDQVLGELAAARHGPPAAAPPKTESHAAASTRPGAGGSSQTTTRSAMGRGPPQLHHREGRLGRSQSELPLGPESTRNRSKIPDHDGGTSHTTTRLAVSQWAVAGEGQSAARWFGAGASRWQRIALLGVQAARALHYAHQRGTLHRDVKPANLLIDAEGVVWISDFGLAKSLEQDEVSQTGDLVGTLRYMAPERFAGKTDARSDIYGLGLSLYEMLTLRPAFEQSHPSTLMRRITTEPPVGPRAVNADIPRDLETIVLKAIAREPVHRYATAEELAEDLERFLTDRPIRARRVTAAERLWRWARRNRAVASLAGLAATLLILVAVVASVGYVLTKAANRQVRDALGEESRQREKVERVMDLMSEALDDIFERFTPNPLGRNSELAFADAAGGEVRVRVEPVLSKEAADLLERMLAFYDRLAKHDPADTRLRPQIADANRRVGVIRRRLGHVEEAEAAYQRALETYRQQESASPDDPVIQAEMARTYNDLGDLCWTARREGAGRAYHLQALEVLKDVPTAPLAPPRLRFELAQTHYFLGRGGPPDSKPPVPRPPGPRPSAKGDRRDGGPGKPRPKEPPLAERARPENAGDAEKLQQAIEILEQLLKEQPAAANYRHLLACCYRDLPPPRADGSGASPFDTVDKAVEILRKLVDDFPDVPAYRDDLCKAYTRVDFRDQPFDARLNRAAETRLREALRISENLVADHPNVPDYAAAQVQILYTMAEVLRPTRRPEDVERTLRRALALQSALVEQFPKAAPYKSWKAILQDSLAKFLADQGNRREARELLESAVAALEEVAKIEPQAADVRSVLGRCYQNLADVLRAMGQDRAAEEVLRRGRAYQPDQ